LGVEVLAERLGDSGGVSGIDLRFAEDGRRGRAVFGVEDSTD
jgi:hypothetical protein